MHFPIIVIEKKNTDKEDFIKYLPSDRTIESETDYYGDIKSDDERKRIISSEWLKRLFEGIATIDTENETITFLERWEIVQTINSYLIMLTEKLHSLAETEQLDFCSLKNAASEYKENSTIFYFNFCGWTSMEFIDETKHHAGETFKIGNIFDAHC